MKQLCKRIFGHQFAKRLALKITFALLLAFIGMSQAQAQNTQDIEIQADRFVVRESENQSEFSGNVIVTQTDMKVWSDRVIVHTGEDGTSDIKSYEAIGNVKIQGETQTATGQRAVYDPETRILVLTGDVVVISESGTVHAQTLKVNMATNVTEFISGDDGERVTGLFTSAN